MNGETSLMERSFAAMARCDWKEARACLKLVVEQNPTAEAYEGLSWAAWSLNEPEELFKTREKAYRLYRQAKDDVSAARIAMWLGSDYVEFRGDLSIGHGWRQRARRLLEGLPITPEHGWLLLLEGDVALMAEEDADRAMELARSAGEIGCKLGVPDIETIGLAMEGVALVTRGEVINGMSLLEEAAASALSGEISDPGYVYWAICYMFYACERLRDLDRAAEWCEKMREYAEAGQMVFLRGICQIRLAGLLILRGDWGEAETQLAEAVNRLMPPLGRRTADATVRLAELRHRQGALKEAEELFREVEWHPMALLGLAELALEAGRPKDAEELIERLLRQVPEASLTQRSAALELLVRIEVLLGNHTSAQQALDAVKNLAGAARTQPLLAAAGFSAASLAVADQRYDEARAFLEDAVSLYERSGAPYEGARARLELASVLVTVGRLERAKVEATLAHKVLQQLDARFYRGRAEALLKDIDRRIRESGGQTDRASQLTERQIEILRLVARGLSNREIADILVVSEHTVHRHIANILQRLDLPSRAAAAVYATTQDLL